MKMKRNNKEIINDSSYMILVMNNEYSNFLSRISIYDSECKCPSLTLIKLFRNIIFITE